MNKFRHMSDDDKRKILNELYNNKQMSLYEVAKYLGVDKETARKHMLRLGLPIRSRTDSLKNAGKKGKLSSRLGKPLSDEEKLEISKSLKQFWQNAPQEMKEQKREESKQQWLKKTPEERRRFIKHGIRKIRESAVHGSKLEKFLLSALTKQGIRVQFHKERWVSQERLQIDLFLPEYNLAIEVDGAAHVDPFFGSVEYKKKMEARDYRKNALLINAGYRVLRIVFAKGRITQYEKGLLVKRIKDIIDNLSDYPQREVIYIYGNEL